MLITTGKSHRKDWRRDWIAAQMSRIIVRKFAASRKWVDDELWAVAPNYDDATGEGAEIAHQYWTEAATAYRAVREMVTDMEEVAIGVAARALVAGHGSMATTEESATKVVRANVAAGKVRENRQKDEMILEAIDLLNQPETAEDVQRVAEALAMLGLGDDDEGAQDD